MSFKVNSNIFSAPKLHTSSIQEENDIEKMEVATILFNLSINPQTPLTNQAPAPLNNTNANNPFQLPHKELALKMQQQNELMGIELQQRQQHAILMLKQQNK